MTTKHEKKELTIEEVAELLRKPYMDRTPKESEEIHHFMTSNIAFFQTDKEADYLQAVKKGTKPHLSKADKMKMYENLMIETHPKGKVLCEYNAYGDRFYIVLDGDVGVRVPLDVEKDLNSTWEVFQFVLNDHENIRMYRDDATKECDQIIKIIGVHFLKNTVLESMDQFTHFLEQLEYGNP